MSHCHVANQIAINAAEPDSVECPECGGSMTQESSFSETWLRCDECSFVDYGVDDE